MPDLSELRAELRIEEEESRKGLLCADCGGAFRPQRLLSQKFCSARCRAHYWRKLRQGSATLRSALRQEIELLEARAIELRGILSAIEMGTTPPDGRDHGVPSAPSGTIAVGRGEGCGSEEAGANEDLRRKGDYVDLGYVVT